ncbi:MAG: hypothetical protein PHN75_04280 [Syntrophales bacterium]|nr:hypothetical protein [Syntrophales bacterium]
MGISVVNIWTSETAYVAPYEHVTTKYHCAHSVATDGTVFWKEQANSGDVLCIR